MSLGIAVAIACLRFLALPPLELADMKMLDVRTAVRGPLAPGGEVVLVAVDEASLAEIGRWPWPRTELAVLFDRLGRAGAAVIGVDIVLDQPDLGIDLDTLQTAVGAAPMRPAGELMASLRPQLDRDVRLAEAFRRSGRVVLGHFFEFGGAPAPTLAAEVARLPELSLRAHGASPGMAGLLEARRVHLDIPVLAESAASSGHINFLTDRDGIYRRLPVAIRAAERLAPAFALEVVRRHLGSVAATLHVGPAGVTAVEVGDRTLPVDAAAQLWINYLGPPGTFPRIAAADVIAGRTPPEALAGKIVLVGFTAAGFDEIATPFAPVAPGVELQATVVDGILHDRSLRRPWWLPAAEAGVVVLLGLVMGLVLRSLGGRGAAVAAAVLVLVTGWGTQLLFTRAHLAVGALYPLAAIVFCTLGGAVFHSIVEEREKRKIRHAFRHYLNPEVTELIARTPERLRLGGERRAITILFSDIQSFTSISEKLPPDVLGELLNQYLGAMTDIVFRHDGLLDKYIGDGLMAFWGAPVPGENNAVRCCRAALDMIAALGGLHERWRSAGLPLLEIRIGINTGEAVVGNFGSAQRFSYTAVGDDVNLAARLEGVNKDYGTQVLVSERTREAIGGEFVCREIDRVTVKGRERAVVIHEILGRAADDVDGRLRRRAAAFAVALAAYRRGAGDEALAALAMLAREYPEDRAVAPFVVRCERMRATAGQDPDDASETGSG